MGYVMKKEIKIKLIFLYWEVICTLSLLSYRLLGRLTAQSFRVSLLR